jgi:hypothetical protein
MSERYAKGETCEMPYAELQSAQLAQEWLSRWWRALR